MKFQCNYCNFKAFSKSQKLEHERAVHEGAVTVCPICDARLKYSSNLDQHIKAMHGTKSFPCDECDVVTKSSVLLNRHKRDHHREKLYKCETCDFKASTPSYLNRHIHYRAFYKKECDECGRKFKDNEKLRIHKMNQCCKFQCSDCRFKTNDEEQFEKHKESLKCKNSFSCDICSYKTSEKRILDYHRKDKHSPNLFQCDECNFKSGYETNISAHKTHNHKRMVCSVCDTATKGRKRFDLHIIAKHGAKRLGFKKNKEICPVCKIVPKTKSAFQNHKFMKHKEGDFIETRIISHDPNKQQEKVKKKTEKKLCNLCNKIFHPSSLAQHKRVKHNEKSKQRLKENVSKSRPEEYFEEDVKKEEDKVYLKQKKVKVEVEESQRNSEKKEVEEYEVAEISSDEDEEEKVEYLEPERLKKELKAEKQLYLCPMGSCTFSLETEELDKQHQHFKLFHSQLDYPLLSFLKL